MGLRRLALLSTLGTLSVLALGWTPDIGAPPTAPPGAPKPASAGPRTWQSGLFLDPASREASRILFRAVYAGSEGVVSGWTGNVEAGVAGDTTAAFKEATTKRINYYRALAGVPADIEHDAKYASAAQAAALIMAANGQLSHTPPKTWKHWSEQGAFGASKSNLALSDVGPGAVNSYMLDPGGTNLKVGHRKWLLSPATRNMGTGDVEVGASNKAANALYVVDAATGAFTTRDAWVAWPPRGYVPYPVVFPRWSFAIDKGDFSSAVVTVLRDGAPLSVTVQSRNEGPSFPAIVFVPSGFSSEGWGTMPRPSQDVRFDVRIDGVLVAGKAKSFTYTTVAFDPAAAGADTVRPIIAGPGKAGVGTQAGYSFQPVPRADAYHWQRARLGGPFHDGAESGAGAWKVQASSAYAVVTGPGASGGKAFRLAHAACQDDALQIDRTFHVDASSKLRFKSRKAWATVAQVARVEVKIEGSGAWHEAWSDTNTAGAAGAFSDVQVSLGSFAGYGVRVRFVYDCTGGSFYPASTGGGWTFDDVSVDASQITEAQEHEVAAAATSFWYPVESGRVLLRVRPRFLGRYWLDWGPGKVVEGAGAPQPPIPPPAGPATPPTPQPTPPTAPTSPPTPTPPPVAAPTAVASGIPLPWSLPWPAPPTPGSTPTSWTPWTGGFAWPFPSSTPSAPPPSKTPPSKPEAPVPATPELPFPLPFPIPSAVPIPLPK
ncbi:MAG: hypothetical protein HYV09_26090 [Deltaproteobacteria bacterium]|nr:hypothetical protein [Deltaproteobacteria bacterium]